MKRNLHRLCILIALTACAAGMSACTDRVSAGSPWSMADLRLLDVSEEGLPPGADILALYTRDAGTDLEIRIDLLDLELVADADLSVHLTNAPGGDKWSMIIVVPAYGYASISPPTDKVFPRVARNPWLDTVTVRINRATLPGQFLVQAQTSIAGRNEPLDVTTPARSDARVINRAPMLLAFSDAFPALTPAQAMRRWDGAHTGPTGERHGLKHILENAQAYQIPVVLLDLKTPANLAALDFLGVTATLRIMEADDLLILPDAAYAEPADMALHYSRLSARGFDLPASRFAWSATGSLLSGERYQFTALPDPTHIMRAGWRRFIPITDANLEAQVMVDGPTLPVRRLLIESALSADPADLVPLGGSLPRSAWGDSDVAAAGFAWLAAHPWVHVLDGGDLARFPTTAGSPPELPEEEADKYRTLLQDAPKNGISDSAWLTYLSLSMPASNGSLSELRRQYLGQVGSLVTAARWAGHPYAQSDCSTDPDMDGQMECVLADEHYFAIIETDGARLTHLYSGEHQLVAPSAQFATGMSDASEWNLALGDAADPGQVMGAFADQAQTYQHYTMAWNGDTLVLTSENGALVKAFYLEEDGMHAEISARDGITERIPLAVDPQRYSLERTEYRAVLAPGAWTWGLEGGTQVRVESTAVFTAQGFTVSIPFLSLPENPDYAYPAGHYLPFPLSMLTLHGVGMFRVVIGVP